MGAMRNASTLPLLLAVLTALSLIACSATHAGGDVAPPGGTAWRDVAAHEWRLVEIEGAGPIGGVDVTLAFDEEGRLSGHTGANRYFASVEHDMDGRFAAGQAGSTRMFRDDPPGLMQQETRYLEALTRATGYRIVDGRLELVADGAVLLAFERA